MYWQVFTHVYVCAQWVYMFASTSACMEDAHVFMHTHTSVCERLLRLA